jgi:hypothetical protein
MSRDEPDLTARLDRIKKLADDWRECRLIQ